MPQGISPNPLNKISEVYLSQISEHHKKDVDGNTIPHEGEDVDEGAGLYANIHAKRKRGGKMRKKGDKGAPSSQDFANAARTAKEEIEIDEAKVDKGRSDYGKASIRNYRRMGPGHDEPGMFDPEGKRGKAIDKRREEHKARRGVKGAKVPAYKVEEVEVDEAMAMKPSNIKKKAKLGAALDRLQALKVAKKKREMGEAFAETGMAKGSGKPSGVMKDFLDKRAKKLEKQRASQSQAARNNPAFDSTRPSPRVKMEALSNWREDYVWEADEEQMEKEVKEKKVKNKIIINPKLGEAVEEIGGEVLEIVEMNGETKEDDPQLKSKMLRQRQLKKQVLLRKLQAVRQTGGEDIVASYEPEGEQLDEIVGKIKQMLQRFRNNPKGKIVVPGGNTIPTAASREKEINDLLNQEYEPEGEQLDEYGNPRVGVRLRVARAIDKVNPKPKMGSKRTAISNKLKMSAIKAETKRREQQENPYSTGKRMKMVATSIGDRVKQKAKAMTTREDYIPEEEYDHYKDRIAMAGGDPSSPDKRDATTMPRRPEKPSKGMTAAQKAAKGRSALDIVKADIRKKYGKGAIMDVGKK